jgi:uncharacterized protein YndB with AHSA1/START domain
MRSRQEAAALMAEHATSIEIHASPDEVFDYLITPEGITAWMGERAVVDPRPDGVFEVDIAGYAIRGRYLEVDRPRRVVVSWGVAGSDELPAGASQVSFTLFSTPGGTRLDVLHSGLPELLIAGHVYGWEHFLPRLVVVAEGGAVGGDDWAPLGPSGTT